MKTIGLMLLVFVVAATGCYIVRAALPYPSDYLTRAKWLEGYSGLNCAGFILNAHGEAALTTLGTLTDPLPLHNGLNGKLDIISNLVSKSAINEDDLLPGDVVTFASGGHVAMYLGPDRWIDSDFRRGDVSEFSLQTKNGDDWFAGSVRVLRWK